MPKLGLGLSLPQTKKVSGAPTPSGINAASAGDLVITFANVTGEVFFKYSNTFWEYVINDEDIYSLNWNPNSWLLTRGGTQAINLTSNSTTIPTTGWVYLTGSGLPVVISNAP